MRRPMFESFEELAMVCFGIPLIILLLWLTFAEEATPWPRKGVLGTPCRQFEPLCDEELKCQRTQAQTLEYLCLP